jgi:GNAT superfamily N-acetyltransferase
MALDNGALQGALVGNIEPYYTGDYFYLRDMFVPFGTQHRGFGRALLSHLIDHLEARSINQIILFTSREFFPFEFYASMGFAELPDMRMMLRASPTNA